MRSCLTICGTVAMVGLLVAGGCGGLGPERDGEVTADPDADPPAPTPDAGSPDRRADAPTNETARDTRVDAPADRVTIPDAPRAIDAPGADRAAPDGSTAEGPPTPGPDAPSPDVTMMCVGPLSGCSPQSVNGLCDPICQVGCPCSEKCAVRGGTAACEPAPANPIPLGGDCSSTSDECRAGAVCLDEFQAVCGAHCYRLCDSDQDCMGGARCTVELAAPGAADWKACSPPPQSCDPTGRAPCLGDDRPSPAFACYPLSAAHGDETVCDCAGVKALGEPCELERECGAGLECVGAAGERMCRRTCRLAADSPCPAGETCTPFEGGGGPSIRYGFCR